MAQGEGGPEAVAPGSGEQLDLSDLDAEELEAIAEVSKKGYYHARPKSEAAPAPQRIDAGALASSSAAGGTAAGSKRAEFDDFQRKWDRFDVEDPETREGPGGVTSVNSRPHAAAPAAAVAQTVPDEGVVAELTAMGFGLEESRAAAVASGNQVHIAAHRLLGGGAGAAATPAAGAPQPRARGADAEKLAQLIEMGIPEKRARRALEACGNNVERAVDHAFSSPPDEDAGDKLRRARVALDQLEAEVAELEAECGRAAVPGGAALAKRLRGLEESVTQASCGLDDIDVSGNEAAREARRCEIDRCNCLDWRLGRLRSSGPGGGAGGAAGQAAADGEVAAASTDGAEPPLFSPGGRDPGGGAAGAETPGAAPRPSACPSAAQARISDAEGLRSAGNSAFKAGDFETAVAQYREALVLDGENVAILSNLAAAEIKLEMFDAAAAHAASANMLSGGFSAKALFRQGQALEGLGQHAAACEAYEAALAIEPSDRLVRQRLNESRAKAAES